MKNEKEHWGTLTVCTARVKHAEGLSLRRQWDTKQGSFGCTFHKSMLALKAIDF